MIDIVSQVMRAGFPSLFEVRPVLQRINRLATCSCCGEEVEIQPWPLPSASDDAAWGEIQEAHAPGGRWAQTRGNRVNLCRFPELPREVVN